MDLFKHRNLSFCPSLSCTGIFYMFVFVMNLQLQRTNPFVIGDSSKDNTRTKMDEFCARLQRVILLHMLQKCDMY